MGIVLKQSIRNTAITYFGFGIGALNTLFLYTQILEPAYYGLVTLILATAAILMPLMAFGTHNTIIKYYSAQPDGGKNSFLTLMLLSPLLLLVPMALATYFLYDDIGHFLAKKNAIVYDYVWYIFVVGLAMAYFEVYYAWSKVHLKSVFGNFMKEVFVRLGVSLLLTALYFDVLELHTFFKALVALYLVRTIIMQCYAYNLRKRKLDFNFPKNTKEILTYSLLIILGGSAALVLLEIDKFMINQFVALENVAFYGVAIYIATVIIVPSRSMHQITYPLTATLLNNNDMKGLRALYKKTSLTLFIASGLLYLLIILNVNDLFEMLPEPYRGGFYIIALIGLAKVTDSLLGNNNSILYNSKYYKVVLGFGASLAIVTILLNLWLIPIYGIEGAALASFVAIVVFNVLKLAYVKLKFDMLPFSQGSFKILVTLILIGILFWYLQFPFHPLVNIVFKSLLITLMYGGILYRFNISEDVSGLLARFLKRNT
ncbi:MAG: lipopolysaccharide biosynthesis protein [Allomuricauda sp.]|nr:MAG: lipopolysaccharide biosynthesis protein [Allomuricauda sp.]